MYLGEDGGECLVEGLGVGVLGDSFFFFFFVGGRGKGGVGTWFWVGEVGMRDAGFGGLMRWCLRMGIEFGWW